MEQQHLNAQNNKLGVIYCPKKGDLKPDKFRKKIEKILNEKGVEYDIVQPEQSKDVAQTSANMVKNGLKTIVVVGGDSALNDVLNSIVQQNKDNRQGVAIGLVANGRTNAFAHYWGIRASAPEQAIDNIIKRRTRKVDIGYVKYTNAKDERCIRYFLSGFTLGLASTIIDLRRKTHTFTMKRKLSFIPSALLAVFKKTSYNIQMAINDEQVGGKLMTVCIGNAPWYGTTPSAVPYNGMLDVLIVGKQKAAHKLKSLYLLFTGKIFNGDGVKPFRTQNIEIQNVGKSLISVDGRIMSTPKGTFKVSIIPETLDFIIP